MYFSLDSADLLDGMIFHRVKLGHEQIHVTAGLDD